MFLIIKRIILSLISNSRYLDLTGVYGNSLQFGPCGEIGPPPLAIRYGICNCVCSPRVDKVDRIIGAIQIRRQELLHGVLS